MRTPVLKGSTHQYLFAQVYNAIVLQSGAPGFFAELLGANSTSHCDHQSFPVRTVLQLFWLSIGRRFCRIKSASEAISESLKFQNFLGELSHKNWSPPNQFSPERPQQKSWSPRSIRGRKISPPGTVRGTAHGPPLLSMVPRPKSVSPAIPGL